jgi:hypothetical protein
MLLSSTIDVPLEQGLEYEEEILLHGMSELTAASHEIPNLLRTSKLEKKAKDAGAEVENIVNGILGDVSEITHSAAFVGKARARGFERLM